MRKSLKETNDETYNAIALHYSGVETTELSDFQKQTLERWRVAHALLRNYPRAHVAARMLQSRFPEISLAQARVDVQSAARLWNAYDKMDREFLENWFVDRLLKEISDPSANEGVRSRNLQTLGSWLKNLPPVTVDPRLLEKNRVNIVFNMDNRQITLTEAEIMKLRPQDRERLIQSVPNTLDESQAADILSS